MSGSCSRMTGMQRTPLTFALTVLSVLLSMTESDEMNSLMLTVMSALDVPASRVALFCSRGNCMFPGNVARNFTIASSVWTCTTGSCYASFRHYVAQEDVFARPGFVFLPRHRSLPSRLSREVARFQKYYSNVQWIFSVDQHEDLLRELKPKCQVLTVSENEINAPRDGYRSCEEREIFRNADTITTDRSPPRGTYPKDSRIIYTLFDGRNKNCGKERFLYIPIIRDVYARLNNTMVELCSSSTGTDSLLLDRNVDMVLGPRPVKCSLRCYFYAYAVRQPEAFCMLVRRRRPVHPSFIHNWLSFFFLCCTLMPVAMTFSLIITVRRRINPDTTIGFSSVGLFLVSTFLGRSPPRSLGPSSASASVMIAAWMMGTFFLLNFVQTEITASRAVPEYSPEIKEVDELTAPLNAGRVLLCTNEQAASRLRDVVSDVSFLASLRRAADSCNRDCFAPFSWDYCTDKIKKGTHVGLIPCVVPLLARAFKSGMEPVKDRFLSHFGWSAVHGRFSLR